MQEVSCEKESVTVLLDSPGPRCNSLDHELRSIKIHPSGTDESNQPEPHQQSPDRSKHDEINKSGGTGGVADDAELTEESSELLTFHKGHGQGPSVGGEGGRSKWVKLRSTIKVACAFTPSTRKRQQLERQDSFLKRFSTRQAGSSQYGEESVDGKEPEASHLKEAETRSPVNFVINPDETFMFAWLTGLTCAVLYNLWTCIAREAFPEIQVGFEPLWFTADALCDLVYLLDIVVQLRTGYLERGLIVYDSLKLTKHYVYSRDFVLDMVSLLPLDLLQIYVGVHPTVRFPRFVKAYRLYRFVYMVETRTAFPNMWRVANLSHVLFLGCHWFAAFYFLISKAEKFSTNWSYPPPVGEFASVTQKYLRSLYWSTLTLTTIGDLQSPESNWEFAFTIASYLIGVFVFATIVGQVGNVITNQNASRHEFERHLDGAKAYMRYHNVPRAMQQRVQRWYDYAWSRGRMNGGGDINSLGLLPDKLKTELALHVNLETLKKVAIFQMCEPEFLHDLVLKMKAYIFTPRDLICRKGEVAREMFIIADGLVEVVSDSGEVLKQMGAGDFFGEIGIMNLDGGVNRRTADVRSLGYSELFVLSRDDVLSAFKDHPEAEVLIKEYGEKRLKELDEHKRRRLCERLAKEISSSNTDEGCATVGKMILATGLLHGIGIGASPKTSHLPKDGSSPVTLPKSSELPNGNSMAILDQGDRWGNLIKMAKSRKNANETGASITESTQACPEKETSRILCSGSKLEQSDVEGTIEITDTNSVGGSKPNLNSQFVITETPKFSEANITGRLAGMFSKKKVAQPRPGKLWSLGIIGKGQTVTKLITSKVSHAKPKKEIRAEIGVDGSLPGFKVPQSRRKSTGKGIDEGKRTEAIPVRHRRGLLEVIRMQPSADIHSSVQSNLNGKSKVHSSVNLKSKSSNESNNSEKTVATFTLGVSDTSDESSRLTSLPSIVVESDPFPLTVAMEDSADLSSRTGWPDVHAVCEEMANSLRTFISDKLVAMQSEYQSHLQQLEEEIAQKQNIIDRLRQDLDALSPPQ